MIVNTKEGKYIHYELNLSVVEELFKWVASLKGEKIDEKKMKHMAMPVPILILSFIMEILRKHMQGYRLFSFL